MDHAIVLEGDFYERMRKAKDRKTENGAKSIREGPRKPGLREAARNRLHFRILFEHRAVERGLRDSIAHARRAGKLLLEAKAKMRRGTFMAWIKRWNQFSQATANIYMRIAREWERIEANSQHVTNLSLGAINRWLRGSARKEPLIKNVQTVLGSETRATPAYPILLRKIEREMAMTKRLREAIWALTEPETLDGIAALHALRLHVDSLHAELQQHLADTPMTDDDIRFALSDAACDDAERARRCFTTEAEAIANALAIGVQS